MDSIWWVGNVEPSLTLSSSILGDEKDLLHFSSFSFVTKFRAPHLKDKRAARRSRKIFPSDVSLISDRSLNYSTAPLCACYIACNVLHSLATYRSINFMIFERESLISAPSTFLRLECSFDKRLWKVSQLNLWTFFISFWPISNAINVWWFNSFPCRLTRLTKP